MSSERRYRLLLLAYPRAYRVERGAELLAVLLAGQSRRGTWSEVAEACSLLRHGVALRVRRRFAGPRVSPALGLAGASMLCLLAIVGVQGLLGSGLRGLGLHGYPDVYGLEARWIDPRWPEQLCWAVTALAFLLRRHRLAVVSAWGAAAVGLWHLLVAAATSVDLPWLGHIGPHWDGYAYWGRSGGAWLLLSLAGAVLLGGPVRASAARAALSSRRWWSVAVAGAAGAGLAGLVGRATFAALGPEALFLSETIRSAALPVVLAAAVLALGLLRASHGRGALALLSVVAAVPFAAGWSEPVALVGAGGVILVVGYVMVVVRRPAERALSQVVDTEGSR